jgi:hypothetical protein
VVDAFPPAAEHLKRAKPILTEQTMYRTRPDVSIDGKRIIYGRAAALATSTIKWISSIDIVF